MAVIARSLNMDKSSLYYYYKGISEILNAILDQEYLDFSVDIENIRKLQGSAAGHLETLKGMIRILLEFYYDNLELLEVILTQISPLFIDPEARHDSRPINHFMESYRLASSYLIEEIRLAIEAGEIDRGLSPQYVLLTARGVILGLAALWRTEKPDREAIPAIAERILRMYRID